MEERGPQAHSEAFGRSADSVWRSVARTEAARSSATSQSNSKEKIMSAISLSSIVAQPTSTTSAISHNPTPWQKYLAERRPEVKQLQEALQSGDLSGAEAAYNNLVSLGKSELHQNNPFVWSNRAADFSAIGGALQSGDLAAAQQAFSALESTFKLPPGAESNPAATSTSQGGVNVIA
jgi:hypothetical protein